jgi:hypothetical protein
MKTIFFILIIFICLYIVSENYKSSLSENFTLIDKYYYNNCFLLTLEQKKVNKKVDQKCNINNNINTNNRDIINLKNECYEKIGVKTVIDQSKNNICNILTLDQKEEINQNINKIDIPEFEGPEYINKLYELEYVTPYNDSYEYSRF